MRLEVDELQAFYASREGQLARRLIANRLRALWPDLRGQSVVGLGYALPFLHVMECADRVVALMPKGQGACLWPPGGPVATALVREHELPLEDGSIDRIVLAHALECSDRLPRLLREIWRVLADGGRLVAIVPNRRGLWCLSERTPFGVGHPYSRRQLEKTLVHHLFAPVGEERALYLPPTNYRLLLRMAIGVERLGLRFAREFSGVVMIEAEKRIYLGNPVGAAQVTPTRRYLPVPQHSIAARELEPAMDADTRQGLGSIGEGEAWRPGR